MHDSTDASHALVHPAHSKAASDNGAAVLALLVPRQWAVVMSNDTCRSVTARARRPHQEERQKGPRRGPKHRKNFATKSAKESAAPSSMKGARKGTATKPIQIPSSSEGGKQSTSDDSESEGASSSDVALAGFHYSNGYSHDSYPSSDM